MKPMTAHELRGILADRSITQEQLADLLDVSLRTVQYWVAYGVNNTPAAMLIRIWAAHPARDDLLKIGKGGK